MKYLKNAWIVSIVLFTIYFVKEYLEKGFDSALFEKVPVTIVEILSPTTSPKASFFSVFSKRFPVCPKETMGTKSNKRTSFLIISNLFQCTNIKARVTPQGFDCL